MLKGHLPRVKYHPVYSLAQSTTPPYKVVCTVTRTATALPSLSLALALALSQTHSLPPSDTSRPRTSVRRLTAPINPRRTRIRGSYTFVSLNSWGKRLLGPVSGFRKKRRWLTGARRGFVPGWPNRERIVPKLWRVANKAVFRPSCSRQLDVLRTVTKIEDSQMS